MVLAMATGNRKDDIIASAKRLFAEGGYMGVSLEAIIADTDTSKGTLYYHFDSKEHIYAAALEDTVGRVRELAYDREELARATPETFWPTLARGWRRAAAHLLENPDEMQLWRGFQRERSVLSSAGPAGRIRERNLELVAEVVARGQELGCVRGDLTPAQCAELVESLGVAADGWSSDRRLPLTLDLVQRLLSPPGSLWRAPLAEAAAE